ncbi:MAG: hypothetical protein JNM19_16105 [Chitinophagaceae bacterium]|nr:hypothetical protein [Chitinophagaceae bacterium]
MLSALTFTSTLSLLEQPDRLVPVTIYCVVMVGVARGLEEFGLLRVAPGVQVY